MSDEYKQTTANVEWTYLVNCTKDEKPADPKTLNPFCAVKITLKDTTPKSKTGLIIGIVILVIAILIGIVVFLG